MSNNNNDDSWILLVIGAIVAAIAFVVWQFSTFFGLDISTGGAVFGRLVALVVVAGAAWKFGEDFGFCRKVYDWYGSRYARGNFSDDEATMLDFKGSQFERDIILWGVR